MPEKKKRVYISWDKKEKRELRAWLARHKHLPWKKIREEYLRQKKKPRSIHSIRSKSDQLERELNPPAKEKETTKDVGSHYPPSLVSQLPPSPPPLDLPPIDPSIQEMIQRWRWEMDHPEDAHAEEELSSEDELSCPATPPSVGQSGYLSDQFKVYDEEIWDYFGLDVLERTAEFA